MLKKMTIDDTNFKGKKVLIRVDFNVPLDENQNITDDTRIVLALPTIKKILKDGGKCILMSHLGRPKGQIIEKMRLTPIAKHLEKLLPNKIIIAPDCIGNEIKKLVDNLNQGEILLLENLRFHKGETKNNSYFAKQLAAWGDIYINDAFGTAHRAHASTEGITHHFEQCLAGYLMEKEINYLGNALANPEHPFITILGGAKISSKIDVIKNLLDKVDTLLIGGAMAFTFLKSQGLEIGKSLLEEDKIDLAKEILDNAKNKGVKILLPVDIIIADKFEATANTKIVKADEMLSDWIGLDIGPKTIELFKEELEKAKTVAWNGPMGVFEMEAFAKATNEITKALADITSKGAITIIGGGDTAAAVIQAGYKEAMSHISTGGGASLAFMEGKELPAISALTDK